MREILFRGKRVDNGEWVYGNLNYGTIEIKSIKDSYYISDFDVNPWDKKFYLVIPESVGQYTGLTDKNGKKIFEGDIVSTPRYNGVVVYGTGCYCIEHGNNSPAIDIVMNDFDVYIIGNIYDNPELLEVGE